MPFGMPTPLFPDQQQQQGLLGSPDLGMGLLGLGSGLLAASGPSPTPVSLGQAIGQGMQGGLQGLMQSRMMRDAEAKQKRDENRAQLDQLKLKMQLDEEQRRADAETKRQQFLSTLSPDKQAFASAFPDQAGPALADQMFPAAVKPMQVGNDIVQLDPATGQMVKLYSAPFAPRQGPEPDRTLVEVYDPNSPTGTSLVPRSEAAGKPGKPSASMMAITGYDAEGRPLMEIGGRSNPASGSTPLTRTSANKVQEDAIAIQDQIDRVGRTSQLWRPEFQTLGPRFGSAITAAKEKLGIEPSPEDAKALEDFTYARQAAATDFNAMVKEQAGTAMTAAEAARVQQQMPNPGTGIMDGDSPTQFKAKLDGRSRDLRLALARKMYLLQRGIPHDFSKDNNGGVEIGDMPAIIDRRGEELEAQGMPPDQVRQALKAEFGL